MKPKDYAEQYRTRIAKGEAKEVVIADIQQQFLREVSELSKDSNRAIPNDLVLIDILKEQDCKWRALSRLVPEIPTAGFIFGIFSVIPEMFVARKERGLEPN